MGLQALTLAKPSWASFSPSSHPPFPTPLPDNVVVVSQEEFLAVLAGVVHHPDSSHKVDHLFAGRVVQVVAALVAPVAVHPLQPELAAGSCPIRHDTPTPLAPPGPAHGPWPQRSGYVLARARLQRTCRDSGCSAWR